mgnify:CR=1 FL=1
MAEGEQKAEHKNVVARSITTEMRESYLDYAMSVITARALPDVRDGLKPVHRRILYAMHEMGLTAQAKSRKSAAVVGDVLGKYHPHGDASVYDAMVKMAQDFSLRYPLIIGQGNFGSIDGDNAAAMRYTEARMSKLSTELLNDIEKETVDWRPNYDNTRKEPAVLPTAVPNLLLNGTLGIAVGMATNIPPHNLREIVAATSHLIDNPDASTEDLLQFVKGPDFPTGAVIYGQKDIAHAYATGKGGIVVRGEAEIVEAKAGTFQIVISSLPYRVNKSVLIENIADQVRDKKIEVAGLRDESTKDIRVVIDLKRGAHPQTVLNYLYKHTQLEETFHLNMVALSGGVPQTMPLKSVLEAFIVHRIEVVTRRTQFDLTKAKDREHILLGLKKALDHIDEIIALIKKSKDVDDARASLMKVFKFSERQANAILDMRLQKLAGLERKKIEDELKEVQALIEHLEDLLKHPKKILALIKTEFSTILEKYGDDRRTKIVKHDAKNFSIEDLIADEESVLVVTAGGYVKRTDPSEYRKQKRGGVGVVDLETKEEDVIQNLVTATTHSDLLFFTDKGKVYQIKMYEIPEGRRATKGKALVNFLSLSDNERVTSILPMSKSVKGSSHSDSVFMVTKHGTGKKVAAKSFHDVRRSGLLAIGLDATDELISAQFVAKGQECVVVTKLGQSIRFKESDVREMGRQAAGVRVITTSAKDEVIAADIANAKDAGSLLVVMANGYGKKTDLEEYKVQKRGGSGIKTAQVTTKTGVVMNAQIIRDEESELVAISKKSQVIRLATNEVPTLGRQTQGVRIMKLREGDGLASVVCI